MAPPRINFHSPRESARAEGAGANASSSRAVSSRAEPEPLPASAALELLECMTEPQRAGTTHEAAARDELWREVLVLNEKLLVERERQAGMLPAG